jgi:anaerobic glycerol-3-phosphate dehydrogenase
MKAFISTDFWLNIIVLSLIFFAGAIVLKFGLKQGSNRQQFEAEYNALKQKIDACSHYYTLLGLKKNVENLYHKYSSFETDIDRLQRRLTQQIEVNRPRATK